MNTPRPPIGTTKPLTDRDPHVTPWHEEEETPHHRAPPRNPGRSLRDWLVLGAGVLLLLYVIGFLFISTSSTPSTGGFSFGQDSVAIIPIQGEITSSSGGGSVDYLEVIRQLDQADVDPSVGVILLDIDSGGGSVVASKQIVARIRSEKKPVVAYIGELGASGAYYSAAAADYIMADSDSITGSIGVVSHQPEVQNLLDKLGISMNEITSGKYKAIGSPFHDMNDDERQVFQVLVNQAFEGFVSDVKSFRGNKLNQLKFSEVLDGRILSGTQALEIGLIDGTGTREEAIMKAAEMGGIKGKPNLVSYQQESFSLSNLLFGAGVSFGEGLKAGLNKSAETNTELSAK